MCKSVAQENPALWNMLDSFFVRLVLRFHWTSKHIAERIRVFEATEDDSAWQLIHATKSIEHPKLKAELFMQALEEAHHAEVFRGLFKEFSGTKLNKQSVPRKAIFKPSEPWKLFAYCAVGESAAANRFQHIASHLPNGVFKHSLQKILEEEAGHVELANDLVSVTGQSEKSINREIRRVKLVRAWESWLRIGRKITSATSRVLLIITYYTIGPLIKPKRQI